MLLVLFFSCQNEDSLTGVEATVEAEQVDAPAASLGVALIDIQTRSITAKHYVKQVVMANLSEQESATVVNINNVLYLDNGEGYDEFSGDGIFTNQELHRHDENVAYNSERAVISYLDSPLVSDDFAYNDELNSFVEDFIQANTSIEKGPYVACHCSIYVENCGGCLIEDLIGGCWCVDYDDCSCSFGWSFP